MFDADEVLYLVQERAGALRTWQPCDGEIESRDRKGKEERDQAIAKNTKRPSVVQVNEKTSRELCRMWSVELQGMEEQKDDANNKQQETQANAGVTDSRVAASARPR